MNNPILMDFLKMRANLNAKNAEKPKKGLKDLPDMDLGTKLTAIIENKPPKKDVEEYFKKKCEMLGDA
jgi:hypothetical protein